MIQDVEDLEPELDRHPVAHGDIFPKAHVPGEKAGSANRVAGLHTISPRGRLGKRRLVKPDGGVSEFGGGDRAVAGQIPELVATSASDASDLLTGPHREASA